MLAYLRRHRDEISPFSFARYLSERHHVLLLNKYDEIAGVTRVTPQIQSEKIKLLVNRLKSESEEKVHVLFVGDNQFFKGLNADSNTWVMHSSGANLNKDSEVYYKTWYMFDDSTLYPKNDAKKESKTRTPKCTSFIPFHVLSDSRNK